jgi:hypothetical protein
MALCYTVFFILIIAGVLFYTGRAASCIMDYQDMPDEEKRTVKIELLCKNVSIMLFWRWLFSASRSILNCSAWNTSNGQWSAGLFCTAWILFLSINPGGMWIKNYSKIS